MDLTERKIAILEAIITDYLASFEPVGSRNLSRKCDLGISAATIRNEMSDLEEMGYLTHPHTSAGRVPSNLAYRFYVNNMMRKRQLSENEEAMLMEVLMRAAGSLEDLMQSVVETLSELTHLTAFAMTPLKEEETLKKIDLIEINEQTVLLIAISEQGKVSNISFRVNEPVDSKVLQELSLEITNELKGYALYKIVEVGRNKVQGESLEERTLWHLTRAAENMLECHLYVDGLTNIFNIPEYQNLTNAEAFLKMMNKKDLLLEEILEREDGIIVTIGEENNLENMCDYSMITATYTVDGISAGKIGVIGPTRMAYDDITSIVGYLTEGLERVFKEEHCEKRSGER